MSRLSSHSTFSAFPNDLTAYGWDEAYQRAFAPHEVAGRVPGRVARVDRGQCELVTQAGPLRADASPLSGPDPESAPCTGDWAALLPATADRAARLVALLPRRTAIVRASASRSSRGQVLAANVDTIAVTVSLDAPLDAGRVERMLALAWESGALPVVVLTKADQCADTGAARAEVLALAPGAEVLVTSARTGEGMDTLPDVLGGTVALIGPSGSGKSTLGNVLLGEERLATGEVRAGDAKGRHTTVRRELFPLPGRGVLIDTPGLRGVGLHETAEGLRRTFPEIEELARDCRFTDCGHDSEPDCAVWAAIESGELPERRLKSYRKLLRENEWAASRHDARLRAERANREKAITRHLRATYRFRDQRP